MSSDGYGPANHFAFVYRDEDGTSQVKAFGGEVSSENLARVRKFSRDSAHLQSFVGNFISLRRDFEMIEGIEHGLISARQSAPSIMHSAMVDTLFAQAEAQRCLSNFLSSAAAFRDRAQTNVSRRYGNPSAQLTELKRAISEEYDGKLSYRIMYNLRNFSVHEDAPISVMPVNMARNESDNLSITTSIVLDKSDLIASSDVNKKVRNELADLNEQTFDIKLLANEYFESHRRILSSIIQRDLPDLKLEYEYFDAIFKGGGIVDNAAPVLMEAHKVGDTLKMILLHVPMEMIEFFDFIESE